jgi:hypothetical protein
MSLRYPKIAKILSKPPLEQTLDNIKIFLMEKNRRYGNSALEPLKIFGKGISDDAGILVRLDDKLSRIRNADELRKNDVADLVGYLILLCVKKEWTDFKDLLDWQKSKNSLSLIYEYDFSDYLFSGNVDNSRVRDVYGLPVGS